MFAHHENARAYLGWLLTNILFLQEQDAFFCDWQDALVAGGFPLYVPQSNSYATRGDDRKTVNNTTTTLSRAYHTLLIRWHLQSFVGPYLPVPQQAHEVLFPHSLSANPLRAGAMGMSVPATMPLPDAEALRARTEASGSRQHAPDHLRGWMAIVQNANRHKQRELTRYARIFRLVHFWRLVHTRHPQIQKVGLPTRYGLFGAFLDVSDRTIRADMELVTHALGSKAWYKSDVL